MVFDVFRLTAKEVFTCFGDFCVRLKLSKIVILALSKLLKTTNCSFLCFIVVGTQSHRLNNTQNNRNVAKLRAISGVGRETERGALRHNWKNACV